MFVIRMRQGLFSIAGNGEDTSGVPGKAFLKDEHRGIRGYVRMRSEFNGKGPERAG
jgi:hypothetical protein